MRVIIIGDVHGRHRDLVEILRFAREKHHVGAAIQVGDFGFFAEEMAQLLSGKIRFPVPLHVIDGNHEDHHWLSRALRSGQAEVWRRESNLIYQPRPSVASVGGGKVGFMGGALHVDRPQRHNLLSRSPNYILRRERDQAAKLFNHERPDLLVTHSCPSGIGIGMESSDELAHGVLEHIVKAGFDPGPRHDCGETELKCLWDDLRHRPRTWVFGHFHRPHDITIGVTRFVCVSGDLEAIVHQPAIWDSAVQQLVQ